MENWRCVEDDDDDDDDEGEDDYDGKEGENSKNEVVHTVKRIVAKEERPKGALSTSTWIGRAGRSSGGNLGANYCQYSDNQRQGALGAAQSPHFEEVLVWRDA